MDGRLYIDVEIITPVKASWPSEARLINSRHEQTDLLINWNIAAYLYDSQSIATMRINAPMRAWPTLRAKQSRKPFTADVSI